MTVDAFDFALGQQQFAVALPLGVRGFERKAEAADVVVLGLAHLFFGDGLVHHLPRLFEADLDRLGELLAVHARGAGHDAGVG